MSEITQEVLDSEVAISDENYDRYFRGRFIQYALKNWRAENQTQQAPGLQKRALHREWWERAGAIYPEPRNYRKWTDKEDELLAEMHRAGLMEKVIAARLNRPITSINRRIRLLRDNGVDLPTKVFWSRTGRSA